MIGTFQRLREVYWVRQVRWQRTPSARPPCLIPLALRGQIHRYIIESAWLRIAEDIVDDVCRHSCVIWRNRSSWGFEGGVVKTDLRRCPAPSSHTPIITSSQSSTCRNRDALQLSLTGCVHSEKSTFKTWWRCTIQYVSANMSSKPRRSEQRTIDEWRTGPLGCSASTAPLTSLDPRYSCGVQALAWRNQILYPFRTCNTYARPIRRLRSGRLEHPLCGRGVPRLFAFKHLLPRPAKRVELYLCLLGPSLVLPFGLYASLPRTGDFSGRPPSAYVRRQILDRLGRWSRCRRPLS